MIRALGFLNNRMVDFGVNIPAEKGKDLYLRLDFRTSALCFCYSYDDNVYAPVGGAQDVTILSDEASRCGNYAGTFVGMFAQDNHTRCEWADFHRFRYELEIP